MKLELEEVDENLNSIKVSISIFTFIGVPTDEMFWRRHPMESYFVPIVK